MPMAATPRFKIFPPARAPVLHDFLIQLGRVRGLGGKRQAAIGEGQGHTAATGEGAAYFHDRQELIQAITAAATEIDRRVAVRFREHASPGGRMKE